MNLPARIFDEVERLSSEGSDSFDDAQFDEAIRKWSAAMSLLPDPKVQWDAYTWLSASIGDAYFELRNFPEAREALFDALNGPDGQENPFVHYRLGQTEMELGNSENAISHLLQAYMLDGEEIFHEDSDGDGSRYLKLLRDRKLI